MSVSVTPLEVMGQLQQTVDGMIQLELATQRAIIEKQEAEIERLLQEVVPEEVSRDDE